MTVTDAIDLFYNEMLNDILNSSADTTVKELLIDDLKSVKQTVTSTYHAEQKKK